MIDSLFDAGWLTRLASYHTLLVGFSGGLDSTVLLHNLSCQPRLAGKLSAVHIHHGISDNADAWLAHCQVFCSSLSVPLIVRQVQFEQRSNLENHARIARYEAFVSLLGDHDGLVLAHHADDQAETVLLQLLRGAGVDGLAAMPAIKALGKGELLRPMLTLSRTSLEAYARMYQLTWVDDESNQDNAFSRNYLRHQVMPVLRSRWPGAVKNLVRSASHCQQAKLNLHALAELDSTGLANTGNILDLGALQTHDHARLANVLRTWLGNNQVRLPPTDTFNRLIVEVIFAGHDSVPGVEWDGVCVRRYQNKLYLLENNVKSCSEHVDWPHFPANLQLPGGYLSVSLTKKGLYVPAGSRLQVRFRKGGESFFWHGHTRVLKKLLQTWHVPPWQRDTLPLIYIDDTLAAVAGFAISDEFYRVDTADTYQLSYIRSKHAPAID